MLDNIFKNAAKMLLATGLLVMVPGSDVANFDSPQILFNQAVFAQEKFPVSHTYFQRVPDKDFIALGKFLDKSNGEFTLKSCSQIRRAQDQILIESHKAGPDKLDRLIGQNLEYYQAQFAMGCPGTSFNAI